MKFSLSSKITLAVVFTLILVMGIGSLVMVGRQKNVLTEKMQREADLLSNSIGLTVGKLMSDNFDDKGYLQEMTEKLGGLPGINEIIIYDPQGIVMADSDREWIGQTKAEDFEDVKKVLETGRTFQGTETVEGKNLYSNAFPIYLEREEKREIVGIGEVNVDLAEVAKTVTLKDQADLLASVVALNLEKVLSDDKAGQDYLQSLTEKIGKTEGVAELIVYNAEGVVIGDTDREWLGKNKAGEFEDLREVLQNKKPHQRYETVEGKNLFSSLVPVFSKDQTLIGVVEASMSMAYVHGQAAQARNRILLLTLVSFLVIGFLMIFLLRRNVLVPIQQLSRVTELIAAGDLSQRAPIRSKDEVGELAASFNSMTQSIQDKNEEIQTFNEELQTANEELKSANEEMEAANEELRETQEKLVQQEKLAAVGQLASGVGHELRNPLGVLKNAAYFLKMKLAGRDEKVDKHLNIMQHEIENSTKIINDLLGFSRTRKPSLAPASVNDIIRDALASLDIPKNVVLSQELDASLPNAMIDRDQVRQVFINVMSNAVQAMSESGGMFNIRTHKEKDFVEAEFRDTGCGIPKENLKKLFDPFFTTKSKGIGLGLAVSHGIVERHHGKIKVTSEVGKGTTFTIDLPTGNEGAS
ncbi:MAG: HAMP domain-containing protein [Deltaproteobacteria bacterium]|nr:HAMP domain-containing protein [Deltaproteobacteria bacterium]MBI4224163.1 HAMP domain-containing protein [Deltaproteobacteria bacterium]